MVSLLRTATIDGVAVPTPIWSGTEGNGMLTQELEQLAQAGGVAIVQAAGQDAWQGFRNAVARWFGRGDVERERAELRRIAATAAAVAVAAAKHAEVEALRQEGLWRGRIEALLEGLGGQVREEAAAEFRALLVGRPGAAGLVFAPGGLVVEGDMSLTAGESSIVAAKLEGGVHLGVARPPFLPDSPAG